MGDKRQSVLNASDETEIVDILGSVKEADIPSLLPLIPRLAKHSYWCVRAETITLIGDFGLKRYTNLVRGAIQDTNHHVRSYAIMAYYDLMEERALPEIRKLMGEKDVHVRLMALLLDYIQTRAAASLQKIRRIVTRRTCDYHHQFAVIHVLGHYLDIRGHPEIVELLTDIRKKVRKTSGVAKHLDRVVLK